MKAFLPSILYDYPLYARSRRRHTRTQHRRHDCILSRHRSPAFLLYFIIFCTHTPASVYLSPIDTSSPMLAPYIPPCLSAAPTLPQSCLSVALLEFLFLPTMLYYLPHPVPNHSPFRVTYTSTLYCLVVPCPGGPASVYLQMLISPLCRSLPSFSHTCLSWTHGPIDAHNHFFWMVRVGIALWVEISVLWFSFTAAQGV